MSHIFWRLDWHGVHFLMIELMDLSVQRRNIPQKLKWKSILDLAFSVLVKKLNKSSTYIRVVCISMFSLLSTCLCFTIYFSLIICIYLLIFMTDNFLLFVICHLYTFYLITPLLSSIHHLLIYILSEYICKSVLL